MSEHSEILARLFAPVEGGMARMRRVLEEQLHESSDAVRDMTDHVGRFRGKQLRAALVLLCGEASGNTTDEHAKVAAIVEMIHLATLVHDDILDGAEVRRRMACVNQRWNNQVAVLLGDFLYARAFGLSTTLSSGLCSRLLSETTSKLCVGEIEQSTRRYDFELSQADYERIAGAKTASLYSAACELGARYPGGNERVGELMRCFGWDLGLAFQIIDDVLDLTETTEQLGKSAGTDVEDGKVTLPVLFVYRSADEGTRAAIRDVYTAAGIEDRARKLAEVCDLGPGLRAAMRRAKDLIAACRERIVSLEESPARTALLEITEFITERRL